MTRQFRWGIVSTIKAPCDAILNFTAWHLEQGASRIFIYLDDANPEAEARLTDHPRVDVIHTDAAHWTARLGRIPPKHQLRQGRNAEHAYARAQGLDWLAHIDVDEFLMPAAPIASVLGDLPATVRAARVRPHEVLSQPDGQQEAESADNADNPDTLCKAWLPANRRSIVSDLYPNYGKYFRGGFLSHVAGKVFARTGQPNIGFRIHDIFEQGARIASQDLPEIALIHDHASDWSHWLANYRYRHAKGSYRFELKGALDPDQGGLTPHQLLDSIEQAGGEDGLRQFFEEMCVATPQLQARLEKHRVLRRYHMGLDQLRQAHFPA